MDKIFSLKNLGAFFILYGLISMFGIVGMVEELTVMGTLELIDIILKAFLSGLIMYLGARIYNGE